MRLGDYQVWENAVKGLLPSRHPGVKFSQLDLTAVRDAFAAGTTPIQFVSQPQLPLLQLKPVAVRVPALSLPIAINKEWLRRLYWIFRTAAWATWTFSVLWVIYGFVSVAALGEALGELEQQREKVRADMRRSRDESERKMREAFPNYGGSESPAEEPEEPEPREGGWQRLRDGMTPLVALAGVLFFGVMIAAIGGAWMYLSERCARMST